MGTKLFDRQRNSHAPFSVHRIPHDVEERKRPGKNGRPFAANFDLRQQVGYITRLPGIVTAPGPPMGLSDWGNCLSRRIGELFHLNDLRLKVVE